MRRDNLARAMSKDKLVQFQDGVNVDEKDLRVVGSKCKEKTKKKVQKPQDPNFSFA